MFISVFMLVLLPLTNLSLVNSYLKPHSKDSLVEGTIGYITSLDPLFLPVTQSDRDLRELMFMKLVELDANGNPLSGIANSWSVSQDGLHYTFYLRKDIVWQDGEPVTADDVVFTVDTGKEIATQFNQDTIGTLFNGVKVEKLSDYSVMFTLEKKNVSFFETASIYIVPEHVLNGISVRRIYDNRFSQYPVGNGPYAIVSNSGDEVVLKANDLYVYGAPKITNFTYAMFSTKQDLEVAFRNQQIDLVSNVLLSNMQYISEYSSLYNVNEAVMPFRRKIIFFNTRLQKLSSSNLRKGISSLIDRAQLIGLSNLDGKVSQTIYDSTSQYFNTRLKFVGFDPAQADALLKKDGYKKVNGYYVDVDGKILSLRLTYVDNETNNSIANTLKSLLNDQGILLDVNAQSYDQMTKETLATRDYDLLLYEIENTIDPDQFDLWHSSRVDYPNLNLAGYKSNRADVYLEKGRVLDKLKDRQTEYYNLQTVINNDTPVIFLYEPQFVYIVTKSLHGVDLKGLKFPEERYFNIYKWSLQ
ncbi:MAG TPA: ABC transporter substrate-binding protein [Candidatus Dojkabacteria bacterium]|nr:ABC transporter substrate-binding protein [Candidatus Dojkabacteria bacterium]